MPFPVKQRKTSHWIGSVVEGRAVLSEMGSELLTLTRSATQRSIVTDTFSRIRNLSSIASRVRWSIGVNSALETVCSVAVCEPVCGKERGIQSPSARKAAGVAGTCSGSKGMREGSMNRFVVLHVEDAFKVFHTAAGEYCELPRLGISVATCDPSPTDVPVAKDSGVGWLLLLLTLFPSVRGRAVS